MLDDLRSTCERTSKINGVTKKIKKIIGISIGAAILLTAILLLVNKPEILDLKQAKTAELPANYDQQTANEIPVMSSTTTEKKDKPYEFSGHTYSIKLEIDKPYFPYMLDGKVTGTITLLEDGKPIKKLSQAARDNYAPNRATDPLIAEIVVNGLLRDGSTKLDLIQSYREPATESYIYSPQAIVAAADSDSSKTTVIDLSSGHATFEVVRGGCGSRNNGVVDIQVAGSIGPLPRDDWNKAMMYTSASLVTEDKVRNFVDLPDQTALVKGSIYYGLTFDPIFVVTKQNQEVKITVKAYDSKTNQLYGGSDQQVLLISHPIRRYWQASMSGDFCAADIAGEFLDGIVSNLFKSKSKSPYASFTTSITEVALKQGVGEATFVYNGNQWLAPEINFSVMPLDAVKTLIQSTPEVDFPGYQEAPAAPKIAVFPYTTTTLAIHNVSTATTETLPIQRANIWLYFLIYQIAKMVLGGLTLYIIRRREQARSRLSH